jgi:hypothetical protein
MEQHIHVLLWLTFSSSLFICIPNKAKVYVSPHPSSQPKWAAADVDDFAERLESVKAAGLAAVSGSLGAALPGLLETGLGPQWEFDTDVRGPS